MPSILNYSFVRQLPKCAFSMITLHFNLFFTLKRPLQKLWRYWTDWLHVSKLMHTAHHSCLMHSMTILPRAFLLQTPQYTYTPGSVYFIHEMQLKTPETDKFGKPDMSPTMNKNMASKDTVRRDLLQSLLVSVTVMRSHHRAQTSSAPWNISMYPQSCH